MLQIVFDIAKYKTFAATFAKISLFQPFSANHAAFFFIRHPIPPIKILSGNKKADAHGTGLFTRSNRYLPQLLQPQDVFPCG